MLPKTTNNVTFELFFNNNELKMMCENRLINIEMVIADLQKTVEELNTVVIEQGRQIEHLQKMNRYLLENMDKDLVKPLSEETPPPHY